MPHFLPRFCLHWLLLGCSLLLPASAAAWNSNGHRLVASIAWLQLSPASRELCQELLAQHPDFSRWQEKSRSTDPAAIFAEAATWADDIRDDPRYYDEGREPATPALPGLIDQRRHAQWHYLDLDANGQPTRGELDQRLEQLFALLKQEARTPTGVWALPWILHLVGDLHQPLHVGHAADGGGTRSEIENPLTPRQPFTSLHRYWDSLPGTSTLRGRRLFSRSEQLLAAYPPPQALNVRAWRAESHSLLAQVYPPEQGSLLPTISEAFHHQARQLAEQRLVAAGYRLGWQLESLLTANLARKRSR